MLGTPNLQFLIVRWRLSSYPLKESLGAFSVKVGVRGGDE